MAADVRKDEFDGENFSVISESAVEQLSSISIESDYIDGEMPTYAIVHEQMRDVLGLQKVASELHLQSNINALNASKQCLNKTLECQGNTIRNLEVSIQNDYVLKSDFLKLRGKLEEERSHHAETQSRLAETLAKLDACHKESVAALTRQRETEQAAFEKCCDSLRDDIQELKSKNRELKSLVEDKTQECDYLNAQLGEQKQEVSRLRNKHEEQKVKFKKKITESEVEKQQEAYMRQMAKDEGKKKGLKNVSFASD